MSDNYYSFRYYPRGQPWIWSYDAIQEAEKAFLATPY